MKSGDLSLFLCDLTVLQTHLQEWKGEMLVDLITQQSATKKTRANHLDYSCMVAMFCSCFAHPTLGVSPGAGCLPDAGGTARSHHLRCVFRGVSEHEFKYVCVYHTYCISICISIHMCICIYDSNSCNMYMYIYIQI